LGHRVEVHVTWEGGDSQRFASQPGEAEVIVAVEGADCAVVDQLAGADRRLVAVRPEI
jgi:hypothetical protein